MFVQFLRDRGSIILKSQNRRRQYVALIGLFINILHINYDLSYRSVVLVLTISTTVSIITQRKLAVDGCNQQDKQNHKPNS